MNYLKKRASGCWSLQYCPKHFTADSFGKVPTRLRPLHAAILIVGIIAGAWKAIPAQSIQPERAAVSQDFVDMAGVVTHFNYTDTIYGSNWPQLFQALQSLGVHHIRDGYFNPDQYPQLVQEHQQLQSAGIRTTYVMPYDPSIPASAIEHLAYETGDMDGIEDPNECDILGQCGGGGSVGVLNAVAFLQNLRVASQDLDIPLIAPSFALPSSYPLAGNLDSLVNLNSVHIYFSGRNPGNSGWGDYDSQGNSFGSLNFWLDQASIDTPGLPSQIGETGYISFPTTSTPYTVPESVAASYVPRTMLLAFKHGYDKTFFYQLVDEPTSPQGYGLLRTDFSEKPEFTALKNLLSLLSDPGGSNFTPGSLPFTILGGDSKVSHLLLQKSDGSYWLALWLEEPSWDPENAVAIPASPENIGVQLGSGYMTTTDYQFNSSGGVVAFNQPMVGNIAPLTVTDQISIIKIISQ